MCETGKLKPAQVVSETVGLDGMKGVLERMGTYGTTGIVVVDSF